MPSISPSAEYPFPKHPALSLQALTHLYGFCLALFYTCFLGKYSMIQPNRTAVLLELSFAFLDVSAKSTSLFPALPFKVYIYLSRSGWDPKFCMKFPLHCYSTCHIYIMCIYSWSLPLDHKLHKHPNHILLFLLASPPPLACPFPSTVSSMQLLFSRCFLNE